MTKNHGLFKLTAAGVFTSFATFSPDGSQGSQIEGGVVMAGDGNFYGCALAGGGEQNGYGFPHHTGGRGYQAGRF